MRKIVNIVGVLGLAVLALIGVRDAVQIARSGVACSVPNTFSNGTTADATQVNANFSALVACFANSASAGANSDITSLTGLTTPLAPAQGGTQLFWGGTSAGVNTVTITIVTPATGFALVAGATVCWTPGFANTAAVTLNVNGTGATALKRYIQTSGGVTLGTLVGGELSTSTIHCAVPGVGAYVLLTHGVDYVGEIKDFGYAGCPTGWLEANGGSFVTATFPDLNTLIGTTWGVAGTMPDLRGRGTAGRDSGGSGRITVAGGNFDGTTVGNTGGAQNQTLTQAQLPSFTMTGTFTATNSITNHFPVSTAAWGAGPQGSGANTMAQSAGSIGDQNGYTPTGSVTGISSGGSGNAHTILQPTGIVTKCVKL